MKIAHIVLLYHLNQCRVGSADPDPVCPGPAGKVCIICTTGFYWFRESFTFAMPRFAQFFLSYYGQHNICTHCTAFISSSQIKNFNEF